MATITDPKEVVRQAALYRQKLMELNNKKVTGPNHTLDLETNQGDDQLVVYKEG